MGEELRSGDSGGKIGNSGKRVPVRDCGSVEAVYNASLFHLEELSLSEGELVWVQVAGLGEDRRIRDCKEIVENTMLQSRG